MTEIILQNSVDLVAVLFTVELSLFISLFYLLLKVLWITSEEKRKNAV